MDGSTVSVERVIKAPPEQIFALLADAGNHAGFDGSESVNHASQQSVPLSMGSKFGMAMKGRKETLFVPYRTTNTVVEYEPDRRIAWQTTAMGGLLGGRIWRYELIPSPEDTGGTLVRETWDVSQDKQKRVITSGSIPKQT
jgi:uncharacterized protein YndB with AHSA1/START domain